MKQFLVLIQLLLALSFTAQTTDLWVNDDLDRHQWKANFNNDAQSFHSALRPYDRLNAKQTAFSIDSISPYQFKVAKSLTMTPILGLIGAGEQNNVVEGSTLTALMSGGLRTGYRPHKKLSLDLDLFGGYALRDTTAFSTLDSSRVVSGIGRGTSAGNGFTFFQPVFAINYSPSEIFDVQVGNGKHFFGHGYRSLLHSDGVAPFPYLKLRTKVWNLQYVNLFSKQEGVFDIFSDPSNFKDKYSATHILSWNVTSSFDVQLFESIIWQGEDRLSNRNFDFGYLNPIIFYRPVEFASGSADNAIVGFGMAKKFRPFTQVYVQIVLDEFLLAHFLERTGWWGNKYGVQAGLKMADAFEVEGLFLQAEVNIARPFTYSHGSPLQNYSHLNEPIAHPLGASFYEGLLIIEAPFKKFSIRDQISYSQFGRDGDQGNLGGNIFRSYFRPEKERGNTISQGVKNEVIQNTLVASYIVDQQTDFRIQVLYEYSRLFGEVPVNESHAIGLGLRMNFRDAYR